MHYNYIIPHSAANLMTSSQSICGLMQDAMTTINITVERDFYGLI